VLSGATNQDKVSIRLATAGVRHWAYMSAIARMLYMLLSLCGVRGKTKNAKLACRTETLHMARMCLAVVYEHQAHADVLHRDEGGFQKD
jgi:hypothetical protein